MLKDCSVPQAFSVLELWRESPDFSTFQIAILQQQVAMLAWAEESDLLQEVAAPQGSWSCLLNAKDRGSYTSMWVTGRLKYG